jgi:hypothetical protein
MLVTLLQILMINDAELSWEQIQAYVGTLLLIVSF